MRFGRFQIDIFSDGTFKIDGGAMFGVVPKVLWNKQKEAAAVRERLKAVESDPDVARQPQPAEAAVAAAE